MTTRVGEVSRAKDTPEGSFVKVLDEIPDQELTIGDTGIVVDGPGGEKLLLTEEIDIPLPLSPSTPLEIVSANVDPRPAVTPTRTPEEFQQEFEAEFSSGLPTEEPSMEARPLSEEEEAEMAELFDMPEEEMSLATQTRLSRLGARARQFGMAASRGVKGTFDLGKAAVETFVAEISTDEERDARREALTRGGELGLQVGAGALSATGAVSESAARFLRRARGAQVRLEVVPAGISIKFEQDDPNADLVVGDIGIVGFGVRRGQRKVLIPSTGEVLTPKQGIQVTVLGESGIRFSVERDGTVTQRKVGTQERASTGRQLDHFDRRSRPIASAFRDDQLEDFFIQPTRPKSVAPAPSSFSVSSVRSTRRPQRPFTPSEGQPTFRELRGGDEQFGALSLFDEERPPIKAKIFPQIDIFGGKDDRILDF